MADKTEQFRGATHPDKGDMHDVSSFPPRELGGVRLGLVIDSADLDDPGHAYEALPPSDNSSTPRMD